MGGGHGSSFLLPNCDIVPHSNVNVAEFASLIHRLAQPEHYSEYQKRFFAWKQRGLRPDFVRKLFQSSDFLTCRLCEYMAHHHFYDDDDDDDGDHDK